MKQILSHYHMMIFERQKITVSHRVGKESLELLFSNLLALICGICGLHFQPHKMATRWCFGIAGREICSCPCTKFCRRAGARTITDAILKEGSEPWSFQGKSRLAIQSLTCLHSCLLALDHRLRLSLWDAICQGRQPFFLGRIRLIKWLICHSSWGEGRKDEERGALLDFLWVHFKGPRDKQDFFLPVWSKYLKRALFFHMSILSLGSFI